MTRLSVTSALKVSALNLLAATCSPTAETVMATSIDTTKVSATLLDLYAIHRDGSAVEPIDTSAPMVDGAVRIEATALRAPDELLTELEELGLTQGQAFGTVINGLLPLEALPAASKPSGLRYLDAVQTPPCQPVEAPRRVPPGPPS